MSVALKKTNSFDLEKCVYDLALACKNQHEIDRFVFLCDMIKAGDVSVENMIRVALILKDSDEALAEKGIDLLESVIR